MKITHRLYLTVIPAVLGVVTVAGLAYWGQYAHAIPELLLGIAALATIGTLILTWVNVRYVVQRIERLAGPPTAGGATGGLRGLANAIASVHGDGKHDELDTISHVVDRLSSAVARAETTAAEREKTFEQRARDYARMLATVSDNAMQRLNDVRLPLHILLENHFGDLNENQEEMLAAARVAAEATDADFVALRHLAELELGLRPQRRDRIFPADLLQSLMPTLNANAEKADVVLQTDLEELIPAIWADQSQLQDALATMLGAAVATANANTTTQLKLNKSTEGARVVLSGSLNWNPTIRTALAARTIEACGGSVQIASGSITITLPAPAPQSK